MSSVGGLACTSCGGPLAPPQGEVRVRCSYCGSTNDIASPGAVRVAKKLEQLGIRVPERPMTIEQIEAGLAQRSAAERERRRTALIVAGVFALVVLAVIGVVVLGSVD